MPPANTEINFEDIRYIRYYVNISEILRIKKQNIRT